MRMTTFNQLATRWDLRPIRNCPGRFIIHTASAELTPRDLLGSEAVVQTFKVSSARDTVLVARFEGGGLISYRRADGKHLHTLNTDEGFKRKLLDLGIKI
jgi:hypothetical protein